MQALRSVRQTASSFIASKLGSYRSPPNLWERCLPAIGAPRFSRHTASTFIAGKRAPTTAIRFTSHSGQTHCL